MWNSCIFFISFVVVELPIGVSRPVIVSEQEEFSCPFCILGYDPECPKWKPKPQWQCYCEQGWHACIKSRNARGNTIVLRKLREDVVFKEYKQVRIDNMK